MNLKSDMLQLASKAREASYSIARLSPADKKWILKDVAQLMKKRAKSIVSANQKDLKTAEEMGLGAAMIDRLTLDQERVLKMAQAVAEVAELPDPVGKTLKKWRRPNGLDISQVTVPLGVILIIYESRPNVTSECASLCLKSGNAVILRGGREAFHSNQAIVAIYQEVLKLHRQPVEAVSLVPTLERDAIDALLQLEDHINLVIPRGGKELIKRVAQNSRVPVVKHYQGICHVFVDKDADLDTAWKIAFNAKCQRVGVCNAMETLLVDRKIAAKFLPKYGHMLTEAGFEIRGDKETRKWIPASKLATEEDWRTEYLDKILSIRIVKDVDEAMNHIRQYGSAHTDSIVTKNKKTAERFVNEVDSSSVMINASTRFSDGNEYGFGAEIGISTDKVHARGPMGLEGLVSYKYIVRGNGQVRS